MQNIFFGETTIASPSIRVVLSSHAGTAPFIASGTMMRIEAAVIMSTRSQPASLIHRRIFTTRYNIGNDRKVSVDKMISFCE
jgi:hypothetical protein